MGLDLTLSNRCRSVLLHCSEFDSDLSLRALFITDELAPFRDGLPEAKNKGDRTDLVLAYLVDKRLSDGRFVLPLFLLRLRSDYHPSNRLYFELDALAQEVLKALNKIISVSPPKEGIPKEPRQTKRVRQPQIIKVTNIIGDGNVIGNGSSSHVGEKDARSNIVVSDDAFDSVQRVYKVFIASPSDVLPERQTVYAVVEKINQTLRIMKRNCFLQVYDWKRSVHPDYGPPQDVISKQISIEDCNIVVGVFWTRFGSPPGNNRPRDGKPYLSGTEKELDDAIAARKRNRLGQPIIMLYRKTSAPNLSSEDDYLQYAKVIEYFRQCQAGGEHPAFVFEFQSTEFESSLEQHLLQAVESLEKSSPIPFASQKLEHQVVSLQEEQPDASALWLREVGLKENPFNSILSQEEPDLLNYFVEVQKFRSRTLISEPRPWIIFAKEGCGKTALRIRLASRCFPQTSMSDVLCVTLGARELGITLERAGKLKNLKSLHYVQTLAQLVVKSVKSSEDGSWDELCQFGFGDESSDSNLPYWLDRIFVKIQQEGFRSLLCLVDQVDEVPDVDGDSHRMMLLLKPLMGIALREYKGFTFRYFLPDYLWPILLEQRSIFRLDRCRTDYLEWDPQDLQKILSQRMTYFSVDRYLPYKSLGQLCAGELSATVDSRIAALAEGNPRAALWLADRFIQLHCQGEAPTRLIQPAVWGRVQFDWWFHGQVEVLGRSSDSKGFYVVADQIYFQDRKVTLSERYHRLLYCLVSEDGRVCSMDSLARAGWLDQNLAGVSTKAIQEAVRRMKLELQNLRIDPRWIKTVRGRGYCLTNPADTDNGRQS